MEATVDQLAGSCADVAATLAKATDDYLRPFVESGIDPNDWVLERGPMTFTHDGDTMKVTESIRLRPKTIAERSSDQVEEMGHA